MGDKREDRDRVAVLEARVAALEQSLREHGVDPATVVAAGNARPKIATLSADVVADNPYSRLMALKRYAMDGANTAAPLTLSMVCCRSSP